MLARDLSVFVDESDGCGGRARYYLLTLVIHNQSENIADKVTRYEQSLIDSDLPNIPFHSEPLLNSHGPYEGIELQARKKMLYSFDLLTQRLPISYRTFVYRRNEFSDLAKLTARMKRDISNLLFDHLELFQGFDEVKVYYDNGQDIMKQALDQSIGFVLSKGVVGRRKTSMTDCRLEQVADYLCTIELAAVEYAAKEDARPTTSSSAASAHSRRTGSSRRAEKLFRELPHRANVAIRPPHQDSKTTVNSESARAKQKRNVSATIPAIQNSGSTVAQDGPRDKGRAKNNPI